jgi:hypothetical protein
MRTIVSDTLAFVAVIALGMSGTDSRSSNSEVPSLPSLSPFAGIWTVHSVNDQQIGGKRKPRVAVSDDGSVKVDMAGHSFAYELDPVWLKAAFDWTVKNGKGEFKVRAYDEWTFTGPGRKVTLSRSE